MAKGWAQFHGRAGARARLERNSRDDLRTLSHPDDGKHAAPTYKTRFRSLLSLRNGCSRPHQSPRLQMQQ